MRSLRWSWLAVLLPLTALAVDEYELGPDSTTRAPGVPAGRIESFSFADSKVFPETRRAGWVYIPVQYDASKPASLIVFQDGHAYVSTNGQQRVPVVLDNLIARGDLPPTVAVFINPGHRGDDGPAADGWGNRNNRSFEYDSLGGAYAKFLIEELLPFVTNRFQLNLSSDPSQRAIAGMSSGGICAFTVAWERPDQFGKVLSQIGSFTNIRGGHAYPALIRKTERKPIRVFLQDGSNDLNNLHGNWPLANQEMASALA
ncbi:MAG: esterase family protein, partial [Verrucomicrobia bacterium]|nr:esterase family protein [Verrucomicrobiota bacterium]